MSASIRSAGSGRPAETNNEYRCKPILISVPLAVRTSLIQPAALSNVGASPLPSVPHQMFLVRNSSFVCCSLYSRGLDFDGGGYPRTTRLIVREWSCNKDPKHTGLDSRRP